MESCSAEEGFFDTREEVSSISDWASDSDGNGVFANSQFEIWAEARESFEDGASEVDFMYKIRNLDDGREFVFEELDQDCILVRWMGQSRKKEAACCQDWMSGNCGRGESCQFLHSWCRGDGFSMLARLVEEEHDGEKKSISGIGYPAGSDKLYSATSGGVVRAWDCHTGLLAGTANVSDYKIGCLISDGDWVFVGYPNGVKAWNFKLGVYHDLTTSNGQVNALEFGLDALYAGAEDGAIFVWKGFADQQADPQFQQPATSLKGHGSAVTCLRASINGDLYRRLYSGSMDGTIKVKFWGCAEDDSDDISLLYTHEEESVAVALGGMNDSEGKPVLFCSWSNCSVGLYELPTLEERGRIYSQKEVRAIRSGPDGLFFTGDANGVVSVWKWAKADAA
ncbi:unnamed protein product [Linum tenue]|uniref:C3H1-type domain-containing protein n=1 Tax=Linum tenue TaxID=586396 RepID=A0AAV0I1Z7_9ROSI|nr:unnamed protein product [Linum tenue]